MYACMALSVIMLSLYLICQPIPLSLRFLLLSVPSPTHRLMLFASMTHDRDHRPSYSIPHVHSSILSCVSLSIHVRPPVRGVATACVQQEFICPLGTTAIDEKMQEVRIQHGRKLLVAHVTMLLTSKINTTDERGRKGALHSGCSFAGSMLYPSSC